MSTLLKATEYVPVPIGSELGGGYFAGYISHTADGNPTHALIVAPRATGATGTGYTLTTNPQWKIANTATANTTSEFDGAANTAAMVTAGIADHPAAQFCVNLSIGGFTDWYFPARLELDIAYFNLKPSTSLNSISFGANVYAVPRRNSNWTATYPTQTSLTAFNTSAEAFVAGRHWASTEGSGGAQGWVFEFSNGNQINSGGTVKAALNNAVRAFRRIAL